MLPKAQYYIAVAHFVLLLIAHIDGAYRSATMTRASQVMTDVTNMTTRQVPTFSRVEGALKCLQDGSCVSFFYKQNGFSRLCSIRHDALPTNKVSHLNLNQEYYVYRERACRRSESACRHVGFTVMHHESLCTCYLVDYSQRNHTESVKFCNGRQSHLFRVDSLKKQELLEKIGKTIKRYFKGKAVRHVYIDGKLRNGKWYFSNGKQLKHLFWVDGLPKTDPRASCIKTSHSINYKWAAMPCLQFGETARICEKELM